MPHTKGTVIAGRLGCLEFDRVHFRGGDVSHVCIEAS